MGTTLGNRVLLSRRDLHIKQNELARLIGVSRTYVSQIETGAVDAIMTDILLKLSNALGVSVSYLLGLTDVPLDNDDAPIDVTSNYITFDVRDTEIRAAIVEVIAILREMTPAQRRVFVEMGQKMQKLLESSDNKAPIIIGR